MGESVASPSGASLEEIERVYRDCAREFERVAAAILRDREVARDVVQDAFASLVRKRDRFDRRGPVDGWAWRAVVNTALNRRRARRRRSSGAALETESLSGLDPQSDAFGVLTELLALPERQRLVVFLRYYADLDYATIGAALGISVGTVGSTLTSAHQTLRRRLPEEVQP